MSTEDLQNKYDRLVDKVRRMRGWQKEWHKYHVRSDLEKAKRLEREVDQLLTEEVNARKSKQREIF